jgi:hypothetical protein
MLKRFAAKPQNGIAAQNRAEVQVKWRRYKRRAEAGEMPDAGLGKVGSGGEAMEGGSNGSGGFEGLSAEPEQFDVPHFNPDLIACGVEADHEHSDGVSVEVLVGVWRRK